MDLTTAVVFDLDGTLIDSAPDIHAAANTVITAHGMAPFTLKDARGFVGHGALVFIERCLAARGRAGDTALQNSILAEFLALYESAVHLTTLYPGVEACLDVLHGRGHALGICTNKPERPTMSVLRHLHLIDRFEVIIGGDSTMARKPDPRPLTETVQTLGARRAVFVGDSEVDAETAQRAGVPFVLYTEGYRKTEVEDMPHDASFADFADLPACIDRLLV